MFEIYLSLMTEDEVFAVARRANVEVFNRAMPVARKVAEQFVRKYTWIDTEDLLHDLALEIPRIMYSYREDNAEGNPWGKYLYFKLQFKVRDILRREDPLGISWPQKKQYPRWHRLGDEGLEGFDPPEDDDIEEAWEYRRQQDRENQKQIDVEIEDWRSYFDGLTGRDKPSGLPRSRTKMRKRDRASLTEWLKQRRQPKQLDLLGME